LAFTRVSSHIILFDHTTNTSTGIGPKVTQSVLTAAFLFAFKDVLYEQTVKLRRKLPVKA
jgi:hypothetical protein